MFYNLLWIINLYHPIWAIDRHDGYIKQIKSEQNMITLYIYFLSFKERMYIVLIEER